MPTIISHPAVLLAYHPAFRFPAPIYIWGVICSILPDIDVLGFRLGIHYGDLFGHRGFTHSLFFAVLVSAILTKLIISRVNEQKGLRLFVFLLLCIASHGILDAFTDGGLGIAFFSPFSKTRYFFPWRPLRVSPIGVGNFLAGPVFEVLGSEFVFLWLPCLLVLIVSIAFHHKQAE